MDEARLHRSESCPLPRSLPSLTFPIPPVRAWQARVDEERLQRAAAEAKARQVPAVR